MGGGGEGERKWMAVILGGGVCEAWDDERMEEAS